MTKIYTTLSICLMLLSHWSIAQKTITESTEESEQYLGFANSDPEEGLKTEEYNELRIKKFRFNGDSCRLFGDSWNAERWYGLLINESKEPIYQLHYALALQSNGKYEEAKEWFLTYDESLRNHNNTNFLATRLKEPRNIKLEKECDKAGGSINLGTISITKLKEINSKGIDFSPMFYENGVVFASNREFKKRSFFSKKFTDKKIVDLFFTEIKEDGTLGGVVSFSEKINSRLHEGPLSFTKDQKTIYFTRNNRKMWKRERDQKGRVSLKIYSAELKEGDKDWKNVKELPFNNNQTTMCHPTISPNGKYIYFSSDQKGGYGGMDLYVSELRGGKWNEPINLGEKVNSKKNEVFPFLHDDGTLYFASNRSDGYGKLDIYYSQMKIVNNRVIWTSAKNMGRPINSKRDDFGFIVNLTKTQGFLSSNRKGSQADDIYTFRLPTNYLNNLENKGFGMKIWLYDEMTKKSLDDVKVTISREWIGNANEFDGTANKEIVDITNRQGLLIHYIKPNYRYTIHTEKEGYYIKDKSFTARMPLMNTDLEMKVSLLSNNKTKLSGKVINQRYKTELSYVKLTLVNQSTGEKTYLRTNQEGEFETCLSCDANYVFFGTRKHFGEGFKEIHLKGKSCKAKNNLILELPPLDCKKQEPKDGGLTSIWATPQEDYKVIVSNLEEESIELNLEEGLIIELNQMHYDYNQDSIEQKSKIELNKLVKLLKLLPSLELEICVYTDTRRNKKESIFLSQSRANKITEYLTSKGIQDNRIIGKGYGMSQLKNDCNTNIECSEEEHKLNRRIEIKVTKFDDAKWIRIEYQE